ncbi:Aldo/keto reductase [Dendrothele bispora CBS 962.96]|uniref:Aldo/keto reductase n=1 Tax=Dendrothele bispora (strain CBS 962.96) TaxID=1314807 RepID=A0A4V4HCS0_DENBC|nr:Aldo/keto reductase [Dendrothele bispora CBS 962.96]
MQNGLHKSYPMRTLGRNGPSVSAIGFGTMGIGVWYGEAKTETEAVELIDAAIARGHTLIDTSDVYGSAEAMVGKWNLKNPHRRSEIFLCSKFGACNLARSLQDDFIPESDPAYVKVALYRSLYMLKTDYIDLYYQHRVDPAVPIEIVLEALREPLERGIIRYLGLSECSVDTLRRAKAIKGIGEKIVAIQVEFSPFSLDIEKNGLAAAAKELGVAIVTYAPLGRGLFSGKYRSRADFAEGDCRLFLPRWTEENFPKNLVLVDQMKAIADRLDVTVSQLTLAWILAQDEHWIPIPGGMTVEHINENAGGAEFTLSPKDVTLIRELVDKADNGGERYPVELLGTLYADSLPLDKWTGRKI